ncbi:hypothetical protein [Salmonella phage SD-12_S18]|nr:hypothetical protein [Salmonella phage SD-12_S18]
MRSRQRLPTQHHHPKPSLSHILWKIALKPCVAFSACFTR